MRILIIEDEKDLASILKVGLNDEGYAVDTASNGEDGWYMIEITDYDLIILDILLPDINGWEILKRIREREMNVPVLMLTALDSTENKVKGLDGGADDYITKPFEFSELLARVRVLLRRSKGKKSPIIEIGNIKIDISGKEVYKNTQTVPLSRREYAILEYLILNRGKVISREELIEHIYDWDKELESNVIDVYINYLRKKISKDFIKTVRGAGYKIPNDI